MPFIGAPNDTDVKQPIQPVEPIKKDSTWGELMGAAFRQENTYGSLINYLSTSGTFRKEQPNYVPEDKDLVGFEKYKDVLMRADSPQELEDRKKYISKSVADQKLLSEGGWKGAAASMAAGIMDPINFIPVGRAASAGFKAARSGLGLVGATLKGIARVGATTAVTGAATEAGLQATQLDRTVERSAMNVVAGAVFGGAIGAASPLLATGIVATGKKIAGRIDSVAPHLINDPVTGQQVISNLPEVSDYSVALTKKIINAGPAAIHKVAEQIDSKMGTKLAGPGPIDWTKDAFAPMRDEVGLARLNASVARVATSGHIPFFQSVSLKGLTSKSAVLRKYVVNTFEQTNTLGMNLAGKATPKAAETLNTLNERELTKAFTETYESIARYKKDAKFFGETVVKDADIGRLVGRAMHNGDVAVGEDLSPLLRSHVEDIAKKLRPLIDKSTDDLKRVGLLTDDLIANKQGKASYFPVKADANKVIENSVQFKKDMTRQFRLYDNKGRLRKDPLQESEAKDLATKYFNDVLNDHDGSLMTREKVGEHTIPEFTDLAKERTVYWSDELIDKWADTNVFNILPKHLIKSSLASTSKDSLKRMGYKSYTELFDDMDLERQALMDVNPGNEAAIAHLFAKERKQLINTINVYNGNYGTVGDRSTSLLRAARKAQIPLKLGNVMLSSTSDVGGMVLRYSLPTTIFNGLGAFLTKKSAAAFLKQGKELKYLSGAIDLESGRLLKALTDGGSNTLESRGAAEIAVDRFVDKTFMKVTGLGYWQTALKTLSSHVMIADTMNSITDSLVKNDVKATVRLASRGIDSKTAEVIRNQFKTYGYKEGNTFVLNMDRWDIDDPAVKNAADTMAQAIVKESHSSVITPGRGDLSFAAQQNEMSKWIFQLSSFAFAATGKITTHILNEQDSRAATGVVTLVTLGMASTALKDLANKGEVRQRTLDQWIMAGIDNSGLTGILGSYSFAGGRALGLIAGSGDRFKGDDWQQVVMGPWARTVTNAINDAHKVSSDQPLTTQQERDIAERWVPYMNVFYIKKLLDPVFNELEKDNINDGLPGGSFNQPLDIHNLFKQQLLEDIKKQEKP